MFIVDGMARVLSAWLAAQHVKETGFILFDDSGRGAYTKGYEILDKAGFRRIDFWGSRPKSTRESCTSIFTKTLSIF